MPKVGERFLGTVVKTAAFGAFVSLMPGKDGLIHISKLGRGKRVGARWHVAVEADVDAVVVEVVGLELDAAPVIRELEPESSHDGHDRRPCKLEQPGRGQLGARSQGAELLPHERRRHVAEPR